MNEQQEKILQQLREAVEQGLNSEAFYQTIREATRLGPIPREFLQDIMKRRLPVGEGPLIPPEKEDAFRNALQRMHEPSERARDADHPVGAVAGAIREALPGFQPWQVDMSKVDLNQMARQFCSDRARALSYLLPPGFTESPSGAYITAERSLLIEDTDGSVLTMGELMEKKTTQKAFEKQVREGSRSSDALGLVWKQPEPLELRAVETLLRDLSAKIIPGAPVRFLPYREPRFRTALRMQLGDNPIPAAIGGVLNRPSVLPEEVHVASIAIYLEPWAAARSGQAIELVRGSIFPWFGQKAAASEEPAG